MSSKSVAPLLVAAIAALALATGAKSQTMDANSASFNAGWGRYAGEENQPVNFAIRDANGNLVIADGVIDSGATAAGFAQASGAASVFSGVGATGGQATAIGNSLNVVTEGDNNTVIVNSVQTNTGAVSATAH